MIPQVLLIAFGICSDHQIGARAEKPQSYTAGYEDCAAIVPYVMQLKQVEEAAEQAKQLAADRPKLKAALAAIDR